MFKKWYFRTTLVLIFLENAAVCWFIEHKLSQGTSLQPILVTFNHVAVVVIGLAGLASLSLFFLDIKGYRIFEAFQERLSSKAWKWGLLILIALVLVEALQDLLLLRSGIPRENFPIFLLESVELFYWAVLVSVQALILIIVIVTQVESGWRKRTLGQKWLPLALIGFGCLLFVFLTGSGYIPNSSKISKVIGDFTTPNAPLLMSQVVISLLLTSLFWLAIQWLRKRSKVHGSSWEIILAVLVLWTAAFMVWSRVPLVENYFLEAPRAPTYQFNVTSDSIYYEIQAHRFLVGEGFSEDIQHPLYSFFLAGLHFLRGDHFQDIYLLQIAVLAVMPFLLFLLVRLLSGSYAGWLAGVLLIIREYNGLLLGDSITVTTVNLLMTESITMLGVILVVFLMISWLKDQRSNSALIYLTGSVIGLLALVRVETLSLYLVLGLLLVFRKWGNWRDLLGKASLVAVMGVLVTVPWMTRNYLKTGDFYLDKGKFFQRTISSYISQLRGENDEPALSQSTNVQNQTAVNLGSVEKIWLHTKNNLVQSILYLPDNHQLFGGLDNYLKIVPEKSKIIIERKGYFSDSYLTSYVKSLPYWRQNWSGFFSPQSVLPITLSFGIALAGFWYLWSRDRLSAVTPVIVLVLHSVIYAVFSRSGGRFIQSVDWIPLLFFAVGLSRILSWSGNQGGLFSELVGIDPGQTQLQAGRSGDWLVWGGIGLCVLIAGAMPLTESLIEPRYTAERLQGQLQLLGEPFADTIQNGSSDLMVYGKVLYPAYYQAGSTVPDNRNGNVPPADQDRLVFYLVGMENIWVSVPLHQAPLDFPHGADVILSGNITSDAPADQKTRQQPYFLAERGVIIDDTLEVPAILETVE